MNYLRIVGDFAVIAWIAILLMKSCETNKNIVALADKLNALSVQVTSKPAVEYAVQKNWPKPLDRIITRVQLKP